MSSNTIPSPARMRQTGLAQASHVTTSSLRSPQHGASLSAFVDFQDSPYRHSSAGSLGSAPSDNPVPDLIPDEVYRVLLAHDLISEKGIRDHIIRKAYKAMRDEQELKSCEALERLQAVYPYLQIDTIRKIIYRIGPAANRKAMMF